MSGEGFPAQPTTLTDITEQTNWAERVIAEASPTDERLDALVRNSNIALSLLAQQGTLDGGINVDPGRDGGPLSDPEFDRLPQDAIGVAAEDINPSDTGPAVFQIQGTRFYSIVTNRVGEEIQAGEAIRVLGGQNGVTTRGAGSLAGGLGAGGGGGSTFRYNGNLYTIPSVTEADESVKVANQLYVQGEREEVEATLEPGEQEVFARIEPSTDSFALLKYTNATAHPDVRYEYFIDDPEIPDPDLSGSVPWATPPDLHEVSPDGYRLVEDFVALRLVNESDTETYTTVQGTLTGLVINATE